MSEGSNFSTFLPALTIVCLFYFSHSGVKIYLTVVLISVSLIMNDTEHLFMCSFCLFIYLPPPTHVSEETSKHKAWVTKYQVLHDLTVSSRTQESGQRFPSTKGIRSSGTWVTYGSPKAEKR